MEWLNIKHVAEQRKSERESHLMSPITVPEGFQRDQAIYSMDEEKAGSNVVSVKGAKSVEET
jgi:hypothetical protein